MEKINITVKKRDDLGKGKLKKLRKEDFIPAVVYGHDISAPLLLDKEAFKVLRSIHFSESAIINMSIEDGNAGEALPVLVKDVQFHPLTEKVI
ncbi:MAG: hypothetical protein GF375_03295, partial [Candidatus Omnitrophica bacterium]|nr:hypothetical protein [Candidatus Omnitrophota bacterium]